jgi:hypothetical protein
MSATPSPLPPPTAETPPKAGVREFVCIPPGTDLSIHLSPDAAGALNREALRGLAAVPRKGMETGGVLLGRVARSENGGRVVSIEGFEPVPCSHSRGPRFELAEEDESAVTEKLARWEPGPDKRIYAVGFYRSHTRRGLSLSEDDVRVCTRWFAGPDNVFLLIKPFGTRPSVGGFFCWNEGKIHAGEPVQEFTFDRGESGGGEVSERVSETPDPKATRPPKLPKSMPPLPPTPVARSRWRLRSALLVLAILAAAIGGFLAFRDLYAGLAQHMWGIAARPPDPPRFNLTVTESGRDLQVDWNRESPDVAAADRGVMVIVDGDYQKTLELSREEVLNGTLVYSRMGGDVNFRLDLFGRGKPFKTASLRFITSEPRPMAEIDDGALPPGTPVINPVPSSR